MCDERDISHTQINPSLILNRLSSWMKMSCWLKIPTERRLHVPLIACTLTQPKTNNNYTNKKKCSQNRILQMKNQWVCLSLFHRFFLYFIFYLFFNYFIYFEAKTEKKILKLFCDSLSVLCTKFLNTLFMLGSDWLFGCYVVGLLKNFFSWCVITKTI